MQFNIMRGVEVDLEAGREGRGRLAVPIVSCRLWPTQATQYGGATSQVRRVGSVVFRGPAKMEPSVAHAIGG